MPDATDPCDSTYVEETSLPYTVAKTANYFEVSLWDRHTKERISEERETNLTQIEEATACRGC
jgi:hypothetical protein